MARVSKIQVFQGITPKPMRDYLTRILRQLAATHERLVVPCAGRFTIPQIAVTAGWSPDRMVCSDISLFSSLLGAAAMGKGYDHLGIRFSPALAELERHRGTPRFAGAVLWAMKYGQAMQKDIGPNLALRRELDFAREDYIAAFAGQIDALANQLAGLHYRNADLFDEIELVRDRPRDLIYVNPPGTTGGYGRMFNVVGAVTWDEPKDLTEFMPKTGTPAILQRCREIEATALIYRFKAIDAEEAPLAIFAAEFPHDRIDYLLSNRPAAFPRMTQPRKVLPIERGAWPLLPYDYQIKPGSQITAQKTTAAVALYYRDLFVHKLGAVRSEIYVALLLDGYLFAVVGFVVNEIVRRKRGKTAVALHETFGFTVPTRYRHMVKLMMLSITCAEMRDRICTWIPEMRWREAFEFRTTCLADVPEVKTNRGVNKLLSRKKLPNGKWHLQYGTQFRDATFADMLKRWLAKEGKMMRASQDEPDEQTTAERAA